MHEQTAQDMLQAGTGFMQSLSEAINKLQASSYKENLVPKYDHFECRCGEIQIYPQDFVVDKVVRFENTSDPDDQSVLFAISSPKKGIKGLYVDSYGSHHDDLSALMLKHLTDHQDS